MKSARKTIKVDVLEDAETDIIELSDDRITNMIQTHNALATALEIKNALHTLILQMDETLSFKLDIQRKYANLKSRHNQLATRVENLEELLEEYEDPTEEESHTIQEGLKEGKKGKSLRVV